MKKNTKKHCGNIIKKVKQDGLEKLLFEGNFGIERENIRVDENGVIAKTPHPKEFGNKMKNPYITVDFSESQLELITPPVDSVEKVYDFLETLHDITSLSLEKEYLWPQSAPPKIINEDSIKVAIFSDEELNKDAKAYRDYLGETYGKSKQILSGVHFNFSFSDKFLKKLYKNYAFDDMNTSSFQEFKNDVYLHVAKNTMRYSWLIVHLLGSSPSVHETYQEECEKFLKKQNDACSLSQGVSFRNSQYGYKNIDDFYIPLTSLEQYTEAIEKLIDKKIIREAREYYSPIRLKPKNPKDLLGSLKQDGIEYVEIRTIDINPYSKAGIDKRDVYFLHAFMIYTLFKKCEIKEKFLFTRQDNLDSRSNQEKISENGLSDMIMLRDKENSKNLSLWAIEIIEEMEEIFKYVLCEDSKYIEGIAWQKEKIENKEKMYSHRILQEIEKTSFVEFHLQKAKQYKKDSEKSAFKLSGYKELELSTQILIKEAIKRGIKFEVIDREDNFVQFQRDGKIELVKQATKTSKDNYVCVEAMNNKSVTKRILDSKAIKTPNGVEFTQIEDALEYYDKVYKELIVIKPKSENFGKGITILNTSFDKDIYTEAVSIAFENGGPILIEEFISGEEFRIFVIDSEVVGILKRIPANIQGDGKSTIEALVVKKNESSLRGVGYKTPLEKIRLGKDEKLFLALQNKDIYYIPKEKEIIYLRENSNISTGGDSVDYTDKIPPMYKKVSIQAANAMEAKICGVDMIIKDINNPLANEKTYAIIEVNFNPAIHIHTFPYIGKGRDIAGKVLDLIGFFLEK